MHTGVAFVQEQRMASTSTTTTMTRPAAGEHPERRGRRWIVGSFVLCGCHLPVMFVLLGTVLGGTAIGAGRRVRVVLAGVIITAVWVAGTWRGFRLVRQVEQGTCPVPRCGRPTSSP